MSKIKLAIIVFILVLIAIMSKGYMMYQAMTPTPITFWQASNNDNKAAISHQLWAEILKEYLSEGAMESVRTFDYKRVIEQDKTKLNNYLKYLQNIDPRDYPKNEQLAYWSNLYNALTIDIILKHYPIDSIKDIGDGFTGPWNIELATVANKSLTLNQIEHGILRGLWKDNRVHYVINCASVGCPDLPEKPLTGSNIEQQLNTAATRFINQSKGVKFNGNNLVLSSIYHWFSVDFGDNEQQLLLHLNQYAKPALKENIDEFKSAITYDYNWKLNAPK